MQQKFLWGGAALFVLGAATSYVAVDYTVRHPTSLLARLGMAAVLSGLNANPLSNANNGFLRDAGEEPGQDQPVANVAPRPSDMDAIGNPAEETIEPIQVDTVPPPTIDRGDDDDFGDDGRFKAAVPPVQQGPKPMPYSDERPRDRRGWSGWAAPGSAVPGGGSSWEKKSDSRPDENGEESEKAPTGTRPLSSFFDWIFWGSAEQIPVMPRQDAPAPSNTLPKADSLSPLTDTMEFRPSDAGRYPLVNGNPY